MKNDLFETLRKVGAVIQDTHVIYTSGMHGSTYVNKDAIYPHTELTSQICKKMAEHFKMAQVEVVVAPAIGAVILGQWVAYHLSQLCGRSVYSVYAEKIENSSEFAIKRGYDAYVKDKRCLIVEDIVNTGGSLLRVVKKVRELGGNVVGAAAICNRGGVTASDLDKIPDLFSLATVALDAWPADQCPLCKKGVPINTSVGKGKKA